jgi:hypothetical protein
MIREISRFPAPGQEPLGLAFHGTALWIACREAHRLYAVDPATWEIREELQTPGAPFGIAAANDEFRVVIGFGDDDDDRYIYRFAPESGFAGDRIACPQLSGVHVAFEGDTLYLSQAHNKRLLALDGRGTIVSEIRLDRRPVGMTIVDGMFYLVTGDENFKNLELTRVDARGETASVTSLASLPFVARALAFDGTSFWTGDRTRNEIVAFQVPAVTSVGA